MVAGAGSGLALQLRLYLPALPPTPPPPLSFIFKRCGSYAMAAGLESYLGVL